MKIIFQLATVLLCSAAGFSQTGIGTDNPNSNSALEIASTTRGLLIPRIALTATNSFAPMTAFVAGMMVYNTATAGVIPNNVVPGFYYSNGTSWLAVSSGVSGTNLYNGDGSLTGNRTVTQAGNTLTFTSTATNGFSVDGTTLSVDAANNRVGIGTAAPTNTFEVNSGTANTSGLKLTNLTSATPVSGGATLGVDGSGNLITVNGNAFVAASGKVTSVATTNVPINTINSNLLQITLPAAGTYLITYSIRGQFTTLNFDQNFTAWLNTANSLASKIADTEILVTMNRAATAVGGTGTGTYIATITAPTTFYVGGTATSGDVTVYSDINGRSSVSYVKVSP